MYDPEATIQDADIEMAAYAREARALDAARARGVCTHSSAVGVSASGRIFYPEQEGLTGSQVRCTDGCGRVFADMDEITSASEAAIYG